VLLPTSMPAAFGCITSSPGSADCNRRVSALRCLRFNAEGRVVAMLGSPHEYDQVGPVAMGVEVSPTGSRSASEDNRSATSSAIAKTGAMLLNGQERASASKSAVAAARGPGEHAISLDASSSFCIQRRRRIGVLRC
jgi:hypothetical protein